MRGGWWVSIIFLIIVSLSLCHQRERNKLVRTACICIIIVDIIVATQQITFSFGQTILGNILNILIPTIIDKIVPQQFIAH